VPCEETGGAGPGPAAMRTSVPDKDERPHFDYSALREATSLGAVGLEMGLSVVVGYAAGHYLDIWLHTSPYMKIVWTVFGVGAAVKSVLVAYKKAKDVGKEDDPGGQDSH